MFVKVSSESLRKLYLTKQDGQNKMSRESNHKGYVSVDKWFKRGPWYHREWLCAHHWLVLQTKRIVRREFEVIACIWYSCRRSDFQSEKITKRSWG
jgi:hypothetical protein